MKHIVLVFLLNVPVACWFYSKATSVDIQYHIHANLTDVKPNVQVEFDYRSDDNGLITLRYENDSWGDKDIFNCIKELDVIPEPEYVRFLPDSNRILIKSKPNINSKIRYQIAQDYHGLPMNERRYRPIVDSSYFIF